MITIKKFTFNPFFENTYVVYDHTKECVIIDGGCYSTSEKEQLSKFIDTHNLLVKKLINTHLHFDHIWGINYLKDRYKVKLFAHKNGELTLKESLNFKTMIGDTVDFEEVEIDNYIDENEIIKFGNTRFEILYVPGHSPCSIAFYNKEERIMFAGDILFKGSIGRTDLAYGDYDTLIKGIKEKLLILPADITIYSGHGEDTILSEEKKHNPFLQ